VVAPDDREFVRAQFYAFLGQVLPRLPEGLTCFLVRDGRVKAKLWLRAGRRAPPPSVDEPELRTIHRRILAAAMSEPQTAKQLARKSRYKLTSYFYTALAQLVEMGRLRHSRQTYRLP
jgi:hypothetical protein